MTDDNFQKLSLNESFERVAKVAEERAAFNAGIEAADLIEALTAENERLRQPQTDALKIARDAIRGLLDITSEYNLDSEQAGRAYAALHEIGTALAALEQSK